MLYPLRFQPLLKRYLWGGRRLETQLGKTLGDGDDYAETIIKHASVGAEAANAGEPGVHDRRKCCTGVRPMAPMGRA